MSGVPEHPTRGTEVLHVLTMCAFAIAAPVYAFLSRDDFLERHHIGRAEVVGLSLAALIVPAAVLMGLRMLISRVSPAAGYLFYFSSLVVLGVIALMPPAIRAGMHWIFAGVIAVGLCVFLVALYRRSPKLRRLVSLISPVAILPPVLLLRSPRTVTGASMTGISVTVLALATGAVLTRLGLIAAARVLKGPRHVRTNFRGNPIIATAGSVLVLPLFAGLGVVLIANKERLVAVVMATAGALTALLGYIDDVYGDRRAGGLIGHAKALLRGTFTTGMLKAGGGALIGLASAWILGWRGVWVVVAGAVIALSSNLANLFDLRPGRVIKFWFVGAGLLALLSPLASGGVVLVAVAGGLAVFIVSELREQVMLGDTGAGLAGVVLGVGAAAVAGRMTLVILAAVLLALTLASETISFTKVIEAVPPLRWFDQLGRKPA